MKTYEPDEIRNVGLFAHAGHGKTSLGDAALFVTKATNRLCRVDEENSNLDYEAEEVKRRSSIQIGLAAVEWRKTKINLLDTPGDSNFYGDTRQAVAVVDAALVLVSASDGAQVGTELTWNMLVERGLPRAIVVNKIDRERASFDKAVASVRELLEVTAVPVALPIGQEAAFSGIVDLVGNKAWKIAADGSGSASATEIPATMQGAVEEARVKLLEAVAETDEALMDKYFSEGALSEEELRAGLKKAFVAGQIVPAFPVSSFKNMAVAQLLDFVVDYFPSPTASGNVHGKKPNGDVAERAPAKDAPLSAYAFKTYMESTGRITLMRIYSGTFSTESQPQNSATGNKERAAAIYTMQGKKQENLTSANAGDIVAAAKLKDTKTTHTLFDDRDPMIFDPPATPPAAIWYAVKPKTQSDVDKVSAALSRVTEEDPSMQIGRDEVTHDFTLGGAGQVHVDVVVERMKRRSGVDVELHLPTVPYKETIRKHVKNVEGKHKKQTGGRGQFGVCYIDMEPGERGTGFIFEDAIVGGSIPRQFIPAVEKGIRETMKRGILAGYEAVDFKVRVFDGKYHDVDSDEMSFQVAGSIAFKEAAKLASPCILEPVMHMHVVVPEGNMGDVMGDLNSRRGRVAGMETIGRQAHVKAQAPLSEIQRYASDLRSMTGGRGYFTTEFSHYQELPPNLADKVIADGPRSKQKEE